MICPFGTVHATTESVNVEAAKEVVCKINVVSQDRVQITFVTTGQSSSNLSILIKYPNSTVLNLGEIDQYSTKFISDVQGTCEVHFDNTNSSESAFVALNYNVDHYIFGIPEMIVVLLAIVVLLMVVVSGYIIMGKYPS
jgi:hypothetical protein